MSPNRRRHGLAATTTDDALITTVTLGLYALALTAAAVAVVAGALLWPLVWAADAIIAAVAWVRAGGHASRSEPCSDLD